MTREAQHRIGHRQLVGGELRRTGIVELWNRIVRRVEAVGADLGQETCGLFRLRLDFAFGCPKRVEIALSVEGQHAGTVLLTRHILLEAGFGEFFQLLSSGPGSAVAGVPA